MMSGRGTSTYTCIIVAEYACRLSSYSQLLEYNIVCLFSSGCTKLLAMVFTSCCRYNVKSLLRVVYGNSSRNLQQASILPLIRSETT